MLEDIDYECDELFYEAYKTSYELVCQQAKEMLSLLEQIQTFFDTDGSLSGELEIRNKVETILNKYGAKQHDIQN